mgnify:FL=1
MLAIYIFIVYSTRDFCCVQLAPFFKGRTYIVTINPPQSASKALAIVDVSNHTLLRHSINKTVLQIHLYIFFLLTQFALKSRPSDTISQYSYESSQSGDSKDVYVTASDIKRRLTESLQRPTGKGKFKVGLFSVP